MNKPEKSLDLLIIGAGVAGLTAAIYAGRLKLNTLLLEDELIGGQIQDAYVVENYPGFNKIKGSELIEKMQEQALNAGTVIDEFDKIIDVDLSNDKKIITTQSAIYKPTSLIIAGGMKRRELPIPEERKFRGKGIHYCEICDGSAYEGKTIAVVGGGNSAVGAALFLTKYAKKIYLIHRSDTLRADPLSQEQLKNELKIEFLPNANIVHALGADHLQAVTLEDSLTKNQRDLSLDALFIQIGAIPKTDLYKNYLTLNAQGSIIAGEDCQTNLAGIFAAGDIRTKPIRQLTTATADGTVAALLAEKYINKTN